MAETRLSDLAFSPVPFSNYVTQMTAEVWRLWQSGAVTSNAELQRLANQGGREYQLPNWNDLTSTDPNIGSDDPASLSTPEAVNSVTQRAFKNFWNQSWSAMNLVSRFATSTGGDPMAVVAGAVARYWSRIYDRRVFDIISTVLDQSVAEDPNIPDVGGSANLARDISDPTTPDQDNNISDIAVIDTLSLLGDHRDQAVMMIAHPLIISELEKQDPRSQTFEKNSDGTMIRRFRGMEVIETSAVPVTGSGATAVFSTFFLGAGAVGTAQVPSRRPAALDWNEAAGDGEGSETLYSRQHIVLHPFGFSYTGALPANSSPSVADITTVGNWTRVYERETIPMAKLLHNLVPTTA